MGMIDTFLTSKLSTDGLQALVGFGQTEWGSWIRCEVIFGLYLFRTLSCSMNTCFRVAGDLPVRTGDLLWLLEFLYLALGGMPR